MNDQNPKSQVGLRSLGFAWSLVIGHWSFLLFILPALLPTYLIRFTIFGLPTNFFEVAVVFVFLAGIFQTRLRRSWREAYYSLPKPVLISIVLFLLSVALSTAIAPHLETSLGILKGWIIVPMMFAGMVYAASKKPPLSPLSGGEFTPSLTREGWGGFPTAKILSSLLLSGLVVALLGLSQLGTLDRIRGPYDVPNSLALFLAPLIILAIFHIPYSIFNRLAAVVMFIALLFTQSLAGVVSALIAVAISLLVLPRPVVKRPLLLLGCFGACVLLALPIFIPKINYLLQPSSSAHVRLQLWSISWDLIRAHPLLGLGLGTFEPAYQQKLHERFARPAFAGQPTPLAEFVFRDPHNWILSFWLNLGLLGLLSFAAIHVYILFKFFLPLTKGEWPPPATVGVVLALLTLLLFGLTDTIFWKNDLAALHFLLVSLALTGYNQSMEKGRKSDMPRRQTLFWDVDSSTIDSEKHARYVIERILDFGHDDEVRWAVHHYPSHLISDVVQRSRVLDPKSRALWSLVFPGSQ